MAIRFYSPVRFVTDWCLPYWCLLDGWSDVRTDKFERIISKHPIVGFVSFVVHAVVLFLNPFIDRVDILGEIPPVALPSTLYLLSDPLFLYAPLINVGTKCLVINNNLKITALVLRSWGDLRYLLRIYHRFKDGGWNERNQRMLGTAFEMLAVLPIPQVAILVFLPNMRGSNSLKIMRSLDLLIVLQYIPRGFPLYLLCKHWNTWNIGDKGFEAFKLPNYSVILINVYGYLVASHILGAFWYFLSIQRAIECWEHACISENGCEFSTSCVQNRHKYITLWETRCPINSPDKQVFDFGIFDGALQSSMQGSSNFFQKWLQCFSWGIRNLSSYGSNLTDTSVHVWENLFVILVSISGLILFMYLLGFVQELMKRFDKLKTIEQAMVINDSNIQLIIFPRYGLPDNDDVMKKKIKLAVKGKLREDENYIVENMFSILSLTQARSFAREIKCTIFLDKLNKVDGLKDKGREALKIICNQLDPMIFSEGSYIIREGEPLHMSFFITGGSVLTYTTNNGGSTGTTQLEKERDDLYGEELITKWAERSSRKLSNLPISLITVKCLNKVEIFALKATEIISPRFNMGNDSVVEFVD